MTWMVKTADLEEYISSTNPDLPYREVVALADEAAALMMSEAAVYSTNAGGTTVSFPSGYVGHVARQSDGFIWRLAAAEGDIATGTSDSDEEAFMAVESMVDALLGEGV